jgi:hypothetical protein
MKTFQLGKYLISFSIASGNTLSDKHFYEYSQQRILGGVYTKKYFSFESRHYLEKNTTVYWIFMWCFLIGVAKSKVNKEKQ